MTRNKTIFHIRTNFLHFIHMKEIKTIDDVIIALDFIVRDSIRTQSRAGYFAALYKRMTMAVSEGIKKRSI